MFRKEYESVAKYKECVQRNGRYNKNGCLCKNIAFLARDVIFLGK